MPWSSKTFDAVCANLRASAQAGDFVPCQWISEVSGDHDGGYRVRGCGWGLVGWSVAVMVEGAEWAKRMLPEGCSQEQVNWVLKQAGLTKAEIKRMSPKKAWEHFDAELEEVYDYRFEDPGRFIDTSVELAEYFISVMARVPVIEDERDAMMYKPEGSNALTTGSQQLELEVAA